MQAAQRGGAPRRQAASQSEEAASAAGQTDEAREPPAPRKQAPREPYFRPGRATMTNVTGYFPPAVK